MNMLKNNEDNQNVNVESPKIQKTSEKNVASEAK